MAIPISEGDNADDVASRSFLFFGVVFQTKHHAISLYNSCYARSCEGDNASTPLSSLNTL